jgi:4-oxalocrotonate tautomerase
MPLVRVSLHQGKSAGYKQAIADGIYRAMRETFDVPEEAELLSQSPGLRRQDVFINLVEVAKENRSFGNGIAQYA